METVERRSTESDVNEQAEFVDEVPSDLRCLLCNLVMDQPYKTSCRKWSCKICLFKILPQTLMSKVYPCPFDHSDDQVPLRKLSCRNGLFTNNVYPDRDAELRIGSRQVSCKNRSRGCTKLMPYSELKKHMKDHCEYNLIPCSNAVNGCEGFLSKYSAQHHESVCEYFRSTCQHCSTSLLRKEEKIHHDLCSITCPNCKANFLTPTRTEVHEKLKCFGQAIPCYFCEGEALNKSEMEKHHEQSQVDHLETLTMVLAQLEKNYCNVKDQVKSKNVIDESNKQQIRKLEVEVAKSAVCELELKKSAFQIALGDEAAKKQADVSKRMKTRLQSLEKSIKDLECRDDLDKQLNDNIVYIKNRLDRYREEYENLSETVDPHLGTLLTKPPVTNGCFTWVVSDFSNFVLQFRNNPNKLFMSVGFHEGDPGYKFQASLDIIKGAFGHEFVNIGLWLMPGDFDNILDWPLTRQARVTLLSHGSHGKRIAYTLPADEDIEEAEQCPPDTERKWITNFGLPTLDLLSSFEKDDTVWIQVDIFQHEWED